MNGPTNGGHYRRKFVNWSERPSNSAASRFAAEETVRSIRELNEWLDEHQAESVVSEAVGLCAAEARRQAAIAAGWKQREPGE